MLTFLLIVIGTFVSEDATCIATGLLIQRGQIGITAGILASTSGIYFGDLALWSIGRVFGRAALTWPWAARRLSHERVQDAALSLARHAAGAIVGSRFLPGTRVVLYVVSGVLGLPGAVFALWSLIAALLWTPTLVLLTAALGDTFVTRATPLLGAAWWSQMLAALLLVLAMRQARSFAGRDRRRRIAARLARWSRWEFWPMWLFYLPVAARIAWLALRHGGLSTITAANPGMPDGGLVGESKSEILKRLPAEWTIPSVLIPRGDIAARMTTLRALVDANAWSLPLILKPDVGQRGMGVKLARTGADVNAYLTAVGDPFVAQPYHPGPFEAGIFYYRMPGSVRGRIFSITDKHFPVLVGDGRSTLEELIWEHPRYRLQAETFVARHRNTLAQVLDAGERFPLAIAGNHCQGTLFRDGRHLITPALEERVDDIARAYPGFFVGRFDVRYSDVEAFKAGRDFAIVELNGVTSESTNIYDPDGTLWNAYRQLFQQWAIIFAIGAANRRAGAPVSPLGRLVALVRCHLTSEAPLPISD